MAKYLRNKNDGTIYPWHALLAQHESVEEVSEEEAFPERFIDKKLVAKVKRRRKKAKAPSLETKKIPEPPVDPTEVDIEFTKRTTV